MEAVKPLNVIEEIKRKLNEEKTTKTTIKAYTQKDFLSLDPYIDEIVKQDLLEEVKDICIKAEKEKGSLFALYILGMVYLKKEIMDTYYMPLLIKTLKENNKKSIAATLAEKVLSYRNEIYALKVLEEYYQEINNIEELNRIREKLMVVSHTDPYPPKALGDFYYERYQKMQKEGASQEEIEEVKNRAYIYYRTALERFIAKNSPSRVFEIWDKIISLYPDKYDVYLKIASRAVSSITQINHKEVAKRLKNVADYLIEKGENGKALEVLKETVIKYGPNDKQLKEALIELYQEIYSGHSKIQEVIKEMREKLIYAKDSFGNPIFFSSSQVYDILMEIEKKLKFDVGKFVEHKNWGIGEIKEVGPDYIVVDFEKKPNHRMSLKIAYTSLETVKENDIRALKYKKKEELKKLAEEKPEELVKLVLENLGGEASTKDIKNLLVPDIISKEEWNDWWLGVKDKLQNVNILPSPEKRSVYILKKGEENIEEELLKQIEENPNPSTILQVLTYSMKLHINFNLPKAQKIIEKILAVLKETLENPKELEDYKTDIVAIASIFFTLTKVYQVTIPVEIQEKLINLISKVEKESAKEVVEKLKILELKRTFIELLVENNQKWVDIIIYLLKTLPPSRLTDYILEKLMEYAIKIEEKGTKEKIHQVFTSIISNYLTDIEMFLEFFSFVVLNDIIDILEEKFNIPFSDLVYKFLEATKFLKDRVEEKINLGVNKKLLSSALDVLELSLNKLIEKGTEEELRVLYTMLSITHLLDESELGEYRKKIVEKYPSLSKELEKGKKRKEILLVSKESYERKKREYERIVQEELPRISAELHTEIGRRADSRDDAEFKSLTEREEQLKAIASRLLRELDMAKIIEPSDIDTSSVSVGTKVKLRDKKTGEIVEYIIGGVWDTDIEKNIVSYQSTLGSLLLDHKIGDTVKIYVEKETKEYEIIDIQPAEIFLK